MEQELVAIILRLDNQEESRILISAHCPSTAVGKLILRDCDVSWIHLLGSFISVGPDYRG